MMKAVRLTAGSGYLSEQLPYLCRRTIYPIVWNGSRRCLRIWSCHVQDRQTCIQAEQISRSFSDLDDIPSVQLSHESKGIRTLSLLQALQAARQELASFLYFASSEIMFAKERPHLGALSKLLAGTLVLLLGPLPNNL